MFVKLGRWSMAASSPIAACGGGSYHVIDQHDLGKATIYLLYNGTANCAVTWKDSSNTTRVGVAIYKQSGGYDSDEGNYSTYAGPVKVEAPGTCIFYTGVYGSGPYWDSPWGHCG
jgi:hypothetical protein